MALKTRRQSRLEEEEGQAAADQSALEVADNDPAIQQDVTSPEKNDQASSASSSSSSSDDESSSEEEEEEDSDSVYSSDEEQDLEKLFQASLMACRQKDEAVSSGEKTSAFEISADQVSFGEPDQKNDDNEAHDSIYDTKGKGKEQSDSLDAHFKRLKRGDELGINRPKSVAKYKRDRKREMKKTAGSKWFDLPAFPSSSSDKSGSNNKRGKANYPSIGPTAEEMTREIQAIRLRNAMDPKRFYRGGNGTNQKGMPAFAQMGRIISSNLEPSSTMNRSERGRTVIDELVKDAQNAAYTKRKFGEQQSRTDVGRSSHIGKHKSRNSGKRQRR